MSVLSEEKQKIFTQFKHLLGWPNRQVEISDEMMEGILSVAIGDYSEFVLNWLIEHQWQSILGKEVDNLDMAFAMSVRDVDYMTRATYAYSKQVGLQTRGPWELKKDYVEIEAGRQVYEIPAGREVNEVLWITPPTTDAALFANFGGFDIGFGGGFAQMGGNAAAGGGFSGMGGNGGHYIAPAFDVLLAAQDFNLKNRMLRSDLVYKITAGPKDEEGRQTKLLHLISTPGSKLSFGGMGAGMHMGNGMSPTSIGLKGCRVWYHYYETTPENEDECKEMNSDIIKMPNEVPLGKLDFTTFNEPTKIFIRQLFVAEAKRTLGRVRGKFGGIVGPPEAQRTMDYESLLSEGNDEKKMLIERLEQRLDRLSTEKQYERAANEAEHRNKHLSYRPMGFYFK
jgi:hypothetical protein